MALRSQSGISLYELRLNLIIPVIVIALIFQFIMQRRLVNLFFIYQLFIWGLAETNKRISTISFKIENTLKHSQFEK